MGLNLKIFKMSTVLFAWRYNTESIANQTDHSAHVFVGKMLRTVMTLWRRYDVQKYTTHAFLFREIQCTKMDNLMI